MTIERITITPYTWIPFGILDEKGRECGVLVCVYSQSVRWDEKALNKYGGTGTYVPCEPAVFVDVHAARDREPYGASTPDVRVGLASDPTVLSKATPAAIAKRVEAARKRYAKKYPTTPKEP